MGKFYEMFEMDAHIGAKELDLQYMKVFTTLSKSWSKSVEKRLVASLPVEFFMWLKILPTTRREYATFFLHLLENFPCPFLACFKCVIATCAGRATALWLSREEFF